jgi:hypothetical protein
VTTRNHATVPGSIPSRNNLFAITAPLYCATALARNINSGGTLRSLKRSTTESITPFWSHKWQPMDMVDELASDLASESMGAGTLQLCRWCRRPIVQPAKGRRREFCKRSCRQRDFESRSKARAHGLDEQQLIVARSSLNELQDLIYVLECSLHDVDRDFPNGFSSADPYDLRETLGWLIAAATPVVRHSVTHSV